MLKLEHKNTDNKAKPPIDTGNCTIPQLVRYNARNWSHSPAMYMKKFGIWQGYTWAEYYETIKYFSLGMICLGLKPGDVACIIGDNEPEWFWAEFAVQAAGGITTGI